MADELNIEELEKQKSGTTEDFIVSWPLYTPFDFFHFVVPQRINRDCPQCKKETTWTLYKQASLVPSEELKDETKWLHYLMPSLLRATLDGPLSGDRSDSHHT